MNDRRLERVNRKIKSRLNLHKNIRTYNKSLKIIKQNLGKLGDKIPRRGKYSVSGGIKDNTLDFLSRSEDLSAQGIIYAHKGISAVISTIKTSKETVKFAIKVGKTGYRIVRFPIRTRERLSGKKYVINSAAKEALWNKLKKTHRSKSSINKKGRDEALNLLKVDKDSITDTGVASIQTAIDARRKLKPYTTLVGKTAKSVSKLTFNIAKKQAVGIARKNQYNALLSLRTRQRELKYGRSGINIGSNGMKIKTRKMRTRVKAARKRLDHKMASASAKGGFKATVKASINITKALGKIISNPFVIKIIALAAIVILFVSILSSVIGGLLAPTTVIIADERTIMKYENKVNQLNQAIQKEIEQLMADNKYDEHVLRYMGEDGRTQAYLPEVLAIMAVKFDQGLNCTNEELKAVEDVVRRMIRVSTSEESYSDSGCVPIYAPPVQASPSPSVSPATASSPSSAPASPSGSPAPPATPSAPQIVGYSCPGHLRLNIYVYTYDMEEVMDELGFTEDKKEWARILASSDLASMFPNVQGLSPETRSPEEIKALIDSAPVTDVSRSALIQTAKSLVGRVGYFWGGKSSARWNPNWGVPTLVTAQGSTTTGTYQPYGLDCSGFVDWAYKTSGVGDMLSGGGTAYQWNQSYSISESDLLPGDLVFKSSPNSSGINHVGLYLGREADGRMLYVHCASGQGVIIDSYSGFRYFRRVFVKFKL